jgi:hypothetical protein
MERGGEVEGEGGGGHYDSGGRERNGRHALT